MYRWRGGLRLAGALAGVAAIAVVGSGPASAAGVPVLVISGRGLGHGVGLAQDGAYWMGRQGASLDQILSHFYPGTGLAQVGNPDVRVAVGGAGADTALSFPGGGQVTVGSGGAQPLGFPVQVPPGGTAVVHQSGGAFTVTAPDGRTVAWTPLDRARVVLVSQTGTAAGTGRPTTPTTSGGLLGLLPFLAPTTTTTPTTVPTRRPAASKPTTTTQPPQVAPSRPAPPPTTTTTVPTPGPVGGPLWATPATGTTVGVGGSGRSYRGALEIQADGSSVSLVNQLDVNDYLQGMGEVLDPSWPAASLEAQAVVARTYALRAMASAGELCADTRCQVYLGAQAEYPAMDQAVAATSGEAVVYGGALAATVYSANAGGITATPEEGFGTNDNAAYPYLPAARYYTQDTDPFHLTVSLADVGARLGYPGALTGVAITAKGPSGRALVVSLRGNAGTRAVSGLTFADDLGLGSNLITLSAANASRAPAPPPPPTSGQALPSNAAALAAAVKAGANKLLAGAPLGSLPGVGPGGAGLVGATGPGRGAAGSGPLAAGPLLLSRSGTARPLAWSTLALLMLVAAGEGTLAIHRKVSLVPAFRRATAGLVGLGRRLPHPGRAGRRRLRRGAGG